KLKIVEAQSDLNAAVQARSILKLTAAITAAKFCLPVSDPALVGAESWLQQLKQTDSELLSAMKAYDEPALLLALNKAAGYGYIGGEDPSHANVEEAKRFRALLILQRNTCEVLRSAINSKELQRLDEALVAAHTCITECKSLLSPDTKRLI